MYREDRDLGLGETFEISKCRLGICMLIVVMEVDDVEFEVEECLEWVLAKKKTERKYM